MKHRILTFLLALALFLGTASGALAAEPDPTAPSTEAATDPTTAPTTNPTMEPTTDPTTEPTTEPTVPQTVTPGDVDLDTVHIYEGMDRAYQDGYAPRIEDGAAILVVPLLPIGEITEIKASLDLGTGPFEAAVYEKIFRLENIVPENGTTEQRVFLVKFRVPLSDTRKNGIYPVNVKITGSDAQSHPVEASRLLYVTIGDVAVSKPQKPPVHYPEVPTAEPVVYIAESRLTPEQPQAGEDFTLTLVLRNSITTKDVKNLLVTVESPSLQLTLLEKSNVIPVEEIKRGEVQELVLHFRTEGNIPQGKQTIQLAFRYDSSRSLNLSSQGTVLVDIRQPASLSYDGARLPAKVFQGDTVPIQVNLMNTGKIPLYNCRIDLDIEGLASGGTVFVGEIPAGENKPGRGSLRVSKEISGDVKGRILISYEDPFGEQFQQTADLTTRIDPKPPEPEETVKAQQPSHWWLFLLLGLALGGLTGFGIPWLIRDRKQRKEDDLRL